MELNDVTVLVTGANRGIGRAIAEELASAGATVLAGVRALDEAHDIDDPRVHRVRVDLSSPEAVEASVRDLPEPAVDVLVNNAGRFAGGLLEQHDPDGIAHLFQSTLVGPVHLTRLLLPSMLERDRGKIVNNTSIVGHAPFPGATVYAAAKAGMHGFTASLRRELDATGVSVLELVTPGVDTDMMGQVQRELDRHIDTSGWGHVQPDEWAAKVAEAIEDDRDVLEPGGREQLAKLLPSKVLDLVTRRSFDR
jgi:NAD(P)-dependent dehydrogenase (short-subunit alcohol dehydrogenase family)